jgi:hypothetical protein
MKRLKTKQNLMVFPRLRDVVTKDAKEMNIIRTLPAVDSKRDLGGRTQSRQQAPLALIICFLENIAETMTRRGSRSRMEELDNIAEFWLFNQAEWEDFGQ